MMETPVFALTRDQIVTRMERATKHRLQMGVEDFVKLYRAGGLPDPGKFADLTALASLLSDTDSLFIKP